MSQDQIERLAALAREFRSSKAENARRKAEVDAAVESAKQQLAEARELLAQLDAVLHSTARSPR